MTTLDRSKQMNLIHEDLARAHQGGRLRGVRGAALERRLTREAERAQSARLELARLLYGGAGR